VSERGVKILKLDSTEDGQVRSVAKASNKKVRVKNRNGPTDSEGSK
jgi:hypothetical protein